MQPSAHVRVPALLARRWPTRSTPTTRAGKVLVLPLDDYYQMPTTWGFFGVDSIANLLIQPPGRAAQAGRLLRRRGRASRPTSSRSRPPCCPVTSTPSPASWTRSGSREVIVRHDLVRGMPGRTFADDRVLAAAIAQVPGLSRSGRGPTRAVAGRRRHQCLRAHCTTGRSRCAARAGRGLRRDRHRRHGRTRSSPLKASTPAPTSPTVLDDRAGHRRRRESGRCPPWTPAPRPTTVTLTGGDVRASASGARAAAVLTPRVDGRRAAVHRPDPRAHRRHGRLAASRPRGARARRRDGRRRGRRARAPCPSTGGAATACPGREPPSHRRPPSRSVRPRRSPSWAPERSRSTPTPPVRRLRLQQLRAAAGRASWGCAGRRSARGRPQVLRLTRRRTTRPARGSSPRRQAGRTYRVRLEYRHGRGQAPADLPVADRHRRLRPGAPRAAHRGEWISYERFVTVDEVADGVQVVLHADVGERCWAPRSPSTATSRSRRWSRSSRPRSCRRPCRRHGHAARGRAHPRGDRRPGGLGAVGLRAAAGLLPQHDQTT